MKKILTDKWITLFLVGFIIVSLSTTIYCWLGKDRGWFMMIWNYFLAGLPLVFSVFVREFHYAGKKIKTSIFLILWLLFFPNSPYMMTDLKYISNVDINVWDRLFGGSDIIMWLFLINIITSVFAGLLAGMISFNEIHKIVNEKFGRVKGWIFVLVISVLSAFGVYIGRFSRVNSWDIIRPWHLIQKIFEYLNSFTLQFTLVFVIAILFVYLPVYILRDLDKIGENIDIYKKEDLSKKE